MGRAIVTFILSLIFIGVLVGIGAEIYQSGVAQGVIDAGRFRACATRVTAHADRARRR